MTTQQRTRWFPKDSTVIEAADIPAIVYLYETMNGIPCALAYSGAKGKPDFHDGFRFQREEGRAAYVNRYFESLRAHKIVMAQRRTDRTTYEHTLKIGDILESSWGYDQTNIDYYQVVKVTAKTADIRPIGQNSQQTGFMCGTCTPVKNDFTGEAKTHRVKEGNSIHLTSYSSANPWNGRQQYWSDGH